MKWKLHKSPPPANAVGLNWGKPVGNDDGRTVAGGARQSGRNTLGTDTAGGEETLPFGAGVPVAKRRDGDYCRHLGCRFEMKDHIAIGNFFFPSLKPSIVLDESFNLPHSPFFILLHYFFFPFCSLFSDCFSRFLSAGSDAVSVPALIVCEQGQRRCVQSR